MRKAGYREDWISIHGAREHNLKDISLELPLGFLVVVTGLSGSGKSTLAFDLLYAEGQRRFLDSAGTYARQFVQQLPRPDVDRIAGLPPTVGIEQRNSRGGGKSTVGTVTEIHHFLRLLYARLGVQYCPECNVAVGAQTHEQIHDALLDLCRRHGDLGLLAPIVRRRKGIHSALADWARSRGYERLRVDGRMHRTDQPLGLERYREHDIEVEVGTLRRGMSPREIGKLADRTLELGKGVLLAVDEEGGQTLHSTVRVCPRCSCSFDFLDPKDFSYNSSRGWCPSCRGFGERFPQPTRSGRDLDESTEDTWFHWQRGIGEECPDCGGSRLKRLARSVYLFLGRSGISIDAIARMTVDEAAAHFAELRADERDALQSGILRDILPELQERLRFLAEVGLGYLQLGRGVVTLSGGENQRIRLAAQLGSNLSGALYVLDEPTIGLHARDNARLLETLKRLRGRGNSLIVVEHDEDTIRQADYIVDLGPGAGTEGGRVVAAGPLNRLLGSRESPTARCLRSPRRFPLGGKRRAVRPRRARSGKSPWLHLEGARANNLKDLSLSLPLGRLVVISGVSGAGKSTLLRECLLPALERLTGQDAAGADTSGRARISLTGLARIRKEVQGDEPFLGRICEIDQSPIGRTPRSVPATYVGVFTHIRNAYSRLPEARARGFGPGRFSFNGSSGRCPKCLGVGSIRLEMSFLPPAFVPCEICRGSRFSPEVLTIRYRGRNIADVLAMSVAEALDFFEGSAVIRRHLSIMVDAGLGYVRLGQTSPTLSGGEAQRLRLVSRMLGGTSAREREIRAMNIFLLEEPTIGLHTADVHQLLGVLQRLVRMGHSVMVIEHNLDVIAEADWVVDLGPEGGDAGGRVVVQGTPERIARSSRSHTGRALAPFLEANR